MHRILLIVAVGGFLAAACCLPAQNLPVTDAEGESWLNHLSRDFNDTSMGKTGRLGPPPDKFAGDGPNLHTELLLARAPQTVTLHGADLYRFNCQGCHGESGLGAPPEINSVVGPVRATSVTLVMQRMKDTGMDISPATASEMARQSRQALLLRIHKGGENMPPFAHLSEHEISALIKYLEELAGVSRSANDVISMTESRERIGEHIAKSTCHICHAATGANPTPEQIMAGAIPPLNTLTTRKDLSGFVRKVTQGAPVSMGFPAMMYRGRMPVFGYLSEDEAADVYLYLTLHPSQGTPAALASTSFRPPARANGTPISGHVRAAADPENPEPVSLVKFAVFPMVLFLFLGTVVAVSLPMAAKAHDGHENECRTCEAPAARDSATDLDHRSVTLSRSTLRNPLRDPANLVVHPRRQ